MWYSIEFAQRKDPYRDDVLQFHFFFSFLDRATDFDQYYFDNSTRR